MHIPQVNQHHQTSPSNDSKQAEQETSMLGSFAGQLVFAEQSTDLFNHVGLNPENRRDFEETIDEKRRNEDLEKTIDVKYWNDQKLEHQVEDDMLARGFGLEIKNQEMIGRATDSENASEGVVHKKNMNSEFSQERILNKKPHLLNPIVHQNLQNGQENDDFLELLKANNESPNKTLLSNFSFSESNEIPKETDIAKNSPFQFGEKLNRQSTTSKIASENGSDLKVKNAGMLSNKADQSTQFSLKKDNSPLNSQNEKNTASLSKKSVNDLNLASKENQKLEGNQGIKEIASKEPKQSNIKEIIDNVKILLSSGKDTIIVRLAPEHLGKLEIKLKKFNGTLSGELKVENQEAKELLKSDFAQLQQDLEAQGIKMEYFSIFVKGELPTDSEFSKVQKNQRLSANSKKNELTQDPVKSGAHIAQSSSPIKNNSGLNILA